MVEEIEEEAIVATEEIEEEATAVTDIEKTLTIESATSAARMATSPETALRKKI